MQVSGFTPRNGNITTVNQSALATAASGGAIANGTYFVQVTALIGGVETPASNEQSITTTGTGISTITVTWTAVTGSTGYKVYFGSSGSGSENVVQTFGAVTTTGALTALPVTSGTPPALPKTNANVAVTTAIQQITLPNAPYPSETIARFVVSGTQAVSWVYGADFVLTATNGCIQLGNTVEVFGIPAGVTQVSVIATATGSTLFICPGDGL